MEPLQVDGTVGYRRNGRKQACEPCRKGKLACDHGAPFCGRCVRRKTTSRCIYHPAPMTKRRASAPLSSPPAPSITSGSTGLSTSPHDDPSRTSCSSSHQSSNRCARDPSSTGIVVPVQPEMSVSQRFAKQNNRYGRNGPKDGWKYAVFRSSTKFYGPTSYSAVFSEHQTNLSEGMLDISENVRKHPGAWQFGEPLLGRQRPGSPTIRENQTITALLNIPSKEICQALDPQDSIVDSGMMTYFIKTLWDTFGPQLSGPRTDEALLDLSDALFKNEETPLPPSPDDGKEWLDTFMGPNVRFEAMGMFFCYLGVGYCNLQDWDPMLSAPENKGRDRRQSAWRMKECADVCLSMCDGAETVNFLVSALIISLKKLETACTGDDTYQVRRHHGDLVITSITSGLHRLPEYGSVKLTAASEYKRRLFNYIYYNDKTHACLYGTPPLLTQTFCDTEPCLDLPDNMILFTADEMLAEASQLDGDGWNTTGRLGITTLLRAKLQLALFREEILQLALGINIEITAQRIIDLHQREQNMFAELPSQLQYYDEENNAKASTGATLYNQAFLFLVHLQNRFLLDRVALARGLPNDQGLLNTAMEIMDITLMFWMKREQLMSFSSAFDWIVVFYAIPAAGVICVELLKATTGQQTTQSSRSDNIQKLTLFVAFLEWIRPTDGNFPLTQRLKKVVKRVLDHVLETPAKEPRDVADVDLPFDPMLANFGDMGDIDWLNTIDWTQGSWMDFN